MITGMTGFGSAEISTNKIKGNVEVKTVNHRFFDIAYFLPPGCGSMEDKIRRIVGHHIKRGRVTVSIKITERPTHALHLNRDAVKQYTEFARLLHREHGLKDHLSVADILRLPGVIDIRETVLDFEALWTVVEKALEKSLKGLVEMRRREGKALARDLSEKLGLMRKEIQKIKVRAKEMLQEKKKIVGPDEFSSFQKSNDINEEIARLTHYIDEAAVLVRSGALIGKKMDFVAQEMQRETNTIGSKVQDKIVANAVIVLKSKIEKIREQSQNVE